MQPRFLDRAEILSIHADQIERYGGRHGVLDAGLLDSALHIPMSGFKDGYVHSDLYEMAAAYLFHIARDHPFVDGNKRTALVSALVFLHLNGIAMAAEEDELEALVLRVAEGSAEKMEIADFLREHTEP